MTLGRLRTTGSAAMRAKAPKNAASRTGCRTRTSWAESSSPICCMEWMLTPSCPNTPAMAASAPGSSATWTRR
jgi:hypothetical protein